VDGNVNSIVSILRCEVSPLLRHYLHHHHTTGVLQVQIIEDLTPGDSNQIDLTPGQSQIKSNWDYIEPVLNFTLPVASRTTGFIYYPSGGGSSMDWWREEKDEIHMCVPMLR